MIRCKLLCEGLRFSLQDEPRGMASAPYKPSCYAIVSNIRSADKKEEEEERAMIGIQENKNKHGKQCFSLLDSSNGSIKHELCICKNKTTTASRTGL